MKIAEMDISQVNLSQTITAIIYHYIGTIVAVVNRYTSKNLLRLINLDFLCLMFTMVFGVFVVDVIKEINYVHHLKRAWE